MSRMFEVKKSVLRELTANHALAAPGSDNEHASISEMHCGATGKPCKPTIVPGQAIG